MQPTLSLRSKPLKCETVRSATVLLVVLVVLVLLSLSVYSFAEIMIAEAEATAAYIRCVESRSFADSGVEYLKSRLLNRNRSQRDDLWDNPALLHSVVVHAADSGAQRGCFSVVAPCRGRGLGVRIRFGVIDESSKLNLNALPLDKRHQKLARQMLMGLNRMTPQIADAILDWLDSDDEPREFGAESAYYNTLSPPYSAGNGYLNSLDELLLVRGVTPELLFGNDFNQNGWLDPNENAADATRPPDNADGVLQSGWSGLLTVDSRESNLRRTGKPRINLNQDSLVHLYDELERELGKRAAQFIIAYRLNGTLNGEADLLTQLDEDEPDAEEVARDAVQRAKEQRGVHRDDSNPEREAGLDGAQRGGIDLSRAPVHRVRSLYDLFGVSVHISLDGVDTILDSPWLDDPRSILSVLPELSEKVTAEDTPTIEGRININCAPREVLKGLPGMTPDLAQAIASAQMSLSETLVGNRVTERETPVWLLNEGLVDIKRLRRLGPYITTQGDVHRGYVIGHFADGGPTAMVEVVLDCSQTLPRVISHRDLPAAVPYNQMLLGRGTTREAHAMTTGLGPRELAARPEL